MAYRAVDQLLGRLNDLPWLRAWVNVRDDGDGLFVALVVRPPARYDYQIVCENLWFTEHGVRSHDPRIREGEPFSEPFLADDRFREKYASREGSFRRRSREPLVLAGLPWPLLLPATEWTRAVEGAVDDGLPEVTFTGELQDEVEVPDLAGTKVRVAGYRFLVSNAHRVGRTLTIHAAPAGFVGCSPAGLTSVGWAQRFATWYSAGRSPRTRISKPTRPITDG